MVRQHIRPTQTPTPPYTHPDRHQLRERCVGDRSHPALFLRYLSLRYEDRHQQLELLLADPKFAMQRVESPAHFCYAASRRSGIFSKRVSQ